VQKEKYWSDGVFGLNSLKTSMRLSMRNYVSFLGLILLLVGHCFAQETETPDVPSPEKAEAIKIDEFGDVPQSEFGPKIAKFVEALSKNDNGRGVIVTYTSLNYPPFRRSGYYLQRKRSQYSKYFGGCHGPLITFIDGPSLDKMRTELWMIPPGVDLPPIERGMERGPAKTAMKGTYRITEGRIDLTEAMIRKARREPANEEETDPGEEDDGPVDRRRNREADISFEFLERLKANSGTLIFYLDESVYDLQRARSIIRQKLRRAAHPDSFKRVKIVFGGYRDEPWVETWDLLPGGTEPEPLPDEKIEPVS
jgi:hypothetical protein